MARCTEIPEKLQNAFAAMAGSGPAYIYQVKFGVFAAYIYLVRFPASLALPRASGLGNLTRVLQAKCLAHVERQCSPLLIYFVCARTTFIF